MQYVFINILFIIYIIKKKIINILINYSGIFWPGDRIVIDYLAMLVKTVKHFLSI